MRRELFHDRVPVENELKAIATAFRTGLAGFAARYGAEIAAELTLPADRLTRVMQGVFDMFLVELGDMEGQIVQTLDKAAAHWRRFPPERGKHGPDIPAWKPPKSETEAQQRFRRARTEIETLKLRIRGGELVADEEVRHVGADLAVRWREACLERPAMLATPMVLTEFGMCVAADMQSRIFWAINRCARAMLTEIHRDMKEARDG